MAAQSQVEALRVSATWGCCCQREVTAREVEAVQQQWVPYACGESEHGVGTIALQQLRMLEWQ